MSIFDSYRSALRITLRHLFLHPHLPLIVELCDVDSYENAQCFQSIASIHRDSGIRQLCLDIAVVSEETVRFDGAQFCLAVGRESVTFGKTAVEETRWHGTFDQA